MMNNVNDTQVGVVATFSEGPTQQVYSQTFTLTAGQPVQLDYKSLMNQNRSLGLIQGVWLDNSQGTAAASVLVNATQQLFSIPAGYQGVSPLYVTADMVLTLSGTGTVVMILNNFPTPVGVWKAS